MKLPDLWITVLLFPLTITPLYAEPADPGPSILTPLTSNEASHWPPPGESMLPTRLRLIEAIDVDGDGQMSDDEVSDTPNALRSLDSDTNSAVDAKRPRWKPQGRRGPRPWGRGPPHAPFGPVSARPVDFSQLFLKYDADNSDGLTINELPESVQGLLPELDRDDNGEADRSELRRLEAFLEIQSDAQQLREALSSEDAPSSQVVERIRDILESAELTRIANESQNASVKRSEWFSYAVTVGAMLISVISFGHLLTSPPPSRTRWTLTDSSPDATRPVLISLGLICVLSLIDLSWTTVRSSSIHFQELNPLGSQLLFNGNSPLVFKATTLAISVLLLFFLRQYRGAQLASWWMCMICTLVTFRWIILDSAILS